MTRTRTLAVGAAALVALVLAAPPAGAQEEGEGEEHPELAEELILIAEEFESLTPEEQETVIHALEEEAEENDGEHADIECIPILLEGGTVDDCREAPNPLLPELNEILWGGLGFVVILAVLAKFGYPAMKKSMNDRTERIRSDLDAAEAAKNEAQEEKARYEASLADAKSEAARIIDDARQTADQLKTDAQTRLNDELAQARSSAMAEIELAKGQAMAELRGEVASIAIGAAEAVVGANLDRNAQVQLVEDYINRVQTSGQG